MATLPITPKLAIYGCFHSQKGRLLEEDGAADKGNAGIFTRSPFQRDRDRIIHSVAFRRLKHKTQVFLYHEGDYFRTRLTHSLEVAQVARTMTRALGLNEDIAEAVALAHDLGHPPFGHAGEDALNIAMQDFGGFDHNEQSLRVLTLLEHRYARFDGLNLTFETIDGVLKHNGPLLKAGQDKHPLRQTIKDLDARWGLDLELFPTAEAQIANLSDDIAYLSHDFDDALRAELLSLEQIADLPVVGRILAELKSEYGILPMGRLTHELTRRLISHFVQDLLTYSHQLLDDFAPKTADDIRHASHPMIGHSAEAAADLRVLRDFLMTNSWRHYKVNRMTSKSRKALAALFQRFSEEVNLLPTDWQKLAASGDEKHKARVIADYLASMTDRYALLEYERIFETGPILS
jgi:dGTPase